MPRLSDALKRKLEDETPFERQQRLEINDEIAALAILQEEAALEAERELELIDIATASDVVIEPVTEQVQPAKANKKPPVKRKAKESAAERRAKDAQRKRMARQNESNAAERRAKDAQRKKVARQNESTEENLERLSQQSQRQAKLRKV